MWPQAREMLNDNGEETDTSDTNVVQTIKVDGCDAVSLKALVDYCYTGHIDITAENVSDILQAAAKIRFERIFPMCEEHLLKSLDLNSINVRSKQYVFTTLRLAKALNYGVLLTSAQTYIRDNFQFLIHLEDFEELPLDCLEALLVDNELNVCREEVVCQAIFKWISTDKSKSKQEYFSRLANHIRVRYLESSVCLT